MIAAGWGTSDKITALSCLVAFLSLALSMRGVGIASGANRIAQSAAWTQLLMKHIEAELLNVMQEIAVFEQLCTAPCASVQDKQSLWESLNRIREESAERLAMLRLLVPVQTLTDLRAEMSSQYDTYFESSDLGFSAAHLHALRDRHLSRTRTFLAELRRVSEAGFAEVSIKRAWVPSIKPKQ